MARNNCKKSFTLVELVLYLALVSVIVLIAAYFVAVILQSKTKSQSIMEVEEQGAQLLNLVTQTIRNADSINSPSSGDSSGILSIDVDDSSKNPTVFEFSGESLVMTVGAEPSVALSNDKIVFTNARFRNLSRTGTPGIIRIEFTLSTNAADKNQEYKYSKNFYASAALR